MRSLQQMGEEGLIGGLDRWFADYLTNPARGLADREAPPVVALAAALACRAAGEGHVCLDLDAVDPEEFPDVPDVSAWREALTASSLVGSAEDRSPLVLAGHRLYLRRLWEHERDLAAWIRGRVGEDPAGVGRLAVDRESLKRRLSGPIQTADGIDWQRVAVIAALRSRLCVITGGPGTGKTTVAARIMALLEGSTHPAERPLLAAPTGKAAERLSQAMAEQGVEAGSMTVHRLIGHFRRRPNHRPGLVIVDEASMADLALMARLSRALPGRSRLLLLGDKDQLSSVEAGAVLGDICGLPLEDAPYSDSFSREVEELTGMRLPAGSANPLRDSIVVLRHSYRFPGDSGVGGLSRAVNAGDADGALTILRDPAHDDVRWIENPGSEALQDRVVEGFRGYLASRNPSEAFEQYRRFCVLTPLRRGPTGVDELNRWIERRLARAGLIRADSRWYSGLPVLISRNDHVQRLYNGDIGILLPDEAGQLQAFFQDGRGGFRQIPPIRLPEHEPAYAMTVHKSQGSEFERVLLLLPSAPVRVVTRELIYTAITRARETVEIWGREEVLRDAIIRRIERGSGLREALWGET